MAVRNDKIPSLLDVVNGQNPDGSTRTIAEVLQRASTIQDDMAWKQGNLIDGHMSSVRTKKAEAYFRRANEGIQPSKGASRTQNETAALLESRGQVDRELAIRSGNPADFRQKQGEPHLQGMHDRFVDTLIYGNEFIDDKSFTGFMPRYNNTANEQVIDAGGTGSNLRSILLVGWSENTVTGIVPKSTQSGLHHFDETANMTIGSDGYPIGDPVEDGITPGSTYLAYRDRWIWRCGLAIEDPRYVVRIANIDLDAMKINPGADGGPWLEMLMLQAEERLGIGSDVLNQVNATFYAPREIATWARMQATGAKTGTNFMWNDYGGQRIASFGGQIPVRRLDALNVDEQRVTSST